MAADTPIVDKKSWSYEIVLARDRQVAEARSAALSAFSLDQVINLPTESLRTLQRLLRHGEQLGVWHTPEEWRTPGVREGLRDIDLRARIRRYLIPELQSSLDSNLLEKAVAQLTRYLVLLRMGPAGLGRSSLQSMSPSSIHAIASSYAPNLFAIAISRYLDQEKPESLSGDLLLSLVRTTDLQPLSRSTAFYLRRECDRMRMLHDHGLWQDVPLLDKASLAEAMSGPKPVLESPSLKDPHRPLPDEYVSLLGTRTLWIVKDLGPNILLLAKKLYEIWIETECSERAKVTVRDLRRAATVEVLERHLWKDSNGQPFEFPPFPLGLSTSRGFGANNGLIHPDDDIKNSSEVRWPPKNYSDFIHLVATLQASHMVVVLLSVGLRSSEILSLPLDCVIYERDGRYYANGRTFKLVQNFEGKKRDWLLPELTVQAIEQQSRLARLSESIALLTPKRCSDAEMATDRLWRTISANQIQSNPSKSLCDINKALVRYARTIGLDVCPGGQPLRSHRFRKTLARLVALALTQAPRLLMDVFGHKSIEMVLYYILSDKNLRAEIEAVSRELRVMRAKEVVDAMVSADIAAGYLGSIDAGGYGGMAATSIHAAVAAKKEQVHRTGATWGAKSAMELAELLTLQGTAWQQVRCGVICTKLAGEVGPCNRSKGCPEPSKCSSECEHRLEEAFLREDVEASVAAAVSGYEAAITAEDEMTGAYWAGQIRANLSRFPLIQKKWSVHPIVQLLMPK